MFGEQWRLEPMSAERKARWRKEIDWLLSVSDHIVEFVPSQQKTKDGSTVEVQKTISILLPLHYHLITEILVRSNLSNGKFFVHAGYDHPPTC